MNEIKTKSFSPCPRDNQHNNFVNRWLFKVLFNFRGFACWWEKDWKERKGRKANTVEGGFHHLAKYFPQKCSRSEMHTFQLSLVVGRDLLFQGYKKNVIAPEGASCLSSLLGVVIN